jgi:hypothetical protein
MRATLTLCVVGCCLTALAGCSSERSPSEGALAKDLSEFLEERVKGLMPEAYWRVYSHGGGGGLPGGGYSYAHVESLWTEESHEDDWDEAALVSTRDRIYAWLDSRDAKPAWRDSGSAFSFGTGDGFLYEYHTERGLGWVSLWLYRTDKGQLAAHSSVTEHLE